MLRASTIIEVLVAMILLSIAVGIGSLSFNTTLSGNNIPLKVKATLTLQEVAATTITTKRYLDETLSIPPILIKKTVVPYYFDDNNFDNNQTDIIHLKLEAFQLGTDDNKSIVPSHQQLIYVGQ